MKRRILIITVVVILMAMSSLLMINKQVLALTATVTATPVTFPQADFVGTPLTGEAPLAVQFTHLYTVTSGSPINSCSWSFGDGTSHFESGSFSTCPPVTHTYTTSGNYIVRLNVAITDIVYSVTKNNYIRVAPPGGWTPTRTPTLGCGSVVVVTSTPTPTWTATPRTATATATSCGVRYITATPSGPTSTPTRTPTNGPTATRTRTPTAGPSATRTPTPTAVVGICSPVTSTIAAPFAFDGAGTFCWQSSNLGGFVNSWNTNSVTINGVNVTNLWVGSGSYPPAIGGFYYVGYNSAVAWGHFEAK